MKAVTLSDLIDALELSFDEARSFLDLTTGKVETVNSELLPLAEEIAEGEEPDLPQWQQEEWHVAKRIVFSPDDFRRLPTKYEINEWEILRDFSESLTDPRIREDLQRSIHGRGAFRMFKDTVHRYHIENDWHAFRTAALRQIAIEWCDENQILWREE